ncbi:LCP family protein [Flexivirga caeni]|nr:LCP family protein [Flexivirga caeni]
MPPGDDEIAAEPPDESSVDRVEALLGDESDEQPKKSRRLKVLIVALVALLAVIVIGVGSVVALVDYGVDHHLTRAALLPTGGAPGQRAVARNPVAGNAQNILLIGSDSRAGSVTDVQGGGGNSDVIQLVHISRGDHKISVVDFPRDLYVAIPGFPMNKINWAYARGGAPLLVATMQNLLGVHIDHVAQIDFTGFADLTNDLGGVDVYVRQGFSEGKTNSDVTNPPGFGSWTTGWHHMDGAQALGFVRERHQLTEGDIDRGRDEQEWLHAVIKKLMKPSVLLNPFKLASATNDIAKYATVDKGMSVGYLDGMAVHLAGLNGSDITYYTAPWSGFATNADGDVDVVNMPQMKLLGRALNRDEMAGYTNGENDIH